MTPVNMGERSKPLRMISCARALVQVMWQETCGNRGPGAAEAEAAGRIVALLLLQAGKINGGAQQARRGACFKL